MKLRGGGDWEEWWGITGLLFTKLRKRTQIWKETLSEISHQNFERIVEATSNFIAGRPKAALLFWFFGGFSCDVWLCFVILVRYKNRKYVKIDVQC